MAQLQSRHASPATSAFSNGSSQPLDLEIPDSQQPPLIQGKEEATLDLLSLYGNGSTSSSSMTCATTGLAPPLVATQDLLQPLEKSIKPGLQSHGLVLGRGSLHTNNMDHYASQQTSYALVNGTLEISSNASYHVNNGEGISEGMRERLEKLAHWSSIQSRLRSDDVNYVSKGQGISLMNKNWQQRPVGLQYASERRPPRDPSEDDEDEDDESFDHGENTKKESLQQKCDALQKMEGKISDKGMTSRSKHSATEQRRRSKINDRFQMLRQLLPKVDQKRDKASFLMEVIEYIQVLQEKVQKYEAVEFVRHQERYKRSSLYQDSIANASYVSSVSTTEVLDSNGYMRSRSSPVASGCEEAFGQPWISSMGQASVLHNKLSQGSQACQSGHENTCVLSKPISLSFSSQPCAVSSLERISVPQPMWESRAVPEQLLYHEEHAGIVEKDLMYSNAESSRASLQSQPTNNKSMSVSLNHVINRDHEKAKVSELSLGSRRSRILVVHRDEVSNSLNRLAAEKQSKVQRCEQEAFAVQGDAINLSSIYSQGLLDTLTQALQSSGVDMNQATISVQIDLGKPGGRAAASNWPKAATLSTGLSQSQSRETSSSSDSELQRKKPKIEIDV